jgi:cytosine/adenosine deaminase-related metal-dependent hydrolase
VAVAYGATERNGGLDEARRGLAECRRFARANRRPLVRGMVGLHASFTVSDATIREAGALARELEVPVHVHVAEDASDVEDARRRGFAGPLERLLELGGLPRGSILAHGVHLDRAQVEQARAAGLWLVQNPRSNENNRVGYPRALAAASDVALGTDGYAADMDEERRALFRLGNGEEVSVLEARVRGGRRLCSALFGIELAEAPSAGAAEVVVREPGGRVRSVVVAGERVVEDGTLVHADLEEIRACARAEASRLWRRMEAIG